MTVDEGKYRRLKDAGFSHQAALVLADSEANELGLEARVRFAMQFSSEPLEDSASEPYLVPFPLGANIISVATSVPSRVRAYRDIEHQADDATRALAEAAVPEAGCMLEVVTTNELLDISLNPVPLIYLPDGEAELPVTVTNLSGGTTDVTVTLTYHQIEG